MKDRIDPLIAERAPWLFSRRTGIPVLRRAVDRLLSYDRTVALAEQYRDWTAADLMADVGRMLSQDVTVKGLDNIPRHGPAMVVANHPTGIADGIILHHLLAPLRPDLFLYANSDILRILPQMADRILPVEWRLEKRTLAKTRDTMARTRTAFDEGRLGVIFPSGRLAKRRLLRLYERPWMPSAAMIARKFDLPVIPIKISARNSALFYLLDKIHPTLRDITLFHETLNKDRQPFRITVGEAISGAGLPAASEAAIDVLRRATLSLDDPAQSGLSMVSVTRRPRWI